MKEKNKDFEMYINGKLVNYTDCDYNEEHSILYTLFGMLVTICLFVAAWVIL